ncbi:hypothetical protein GOEFS_021_00140 [Gordonia effusa NBRC 100432]|uniref:Uncharacterized protein n=1 Tax=Gordonia effusa NBRC 100432 TaxID=1077974 RepID=H0QWI6_9ACTN|nr:VC0807 family protein [Gordonia effusa]GAB17187.1 hypothetical protein GOEFS_021_00140 [Gordonia effusa NBRC 100432]
MSLPLADTESPPAPPTALILDVVLQLSVYFTLRYLFGTDQLVALVAGTTLVAVRIVVRSVIRRSTDPLELFTLTLLGCSIVAAAISGSPRVILLVETSIGAVTFCMIAAGLVLRRRAAATLIMRMSVHGDTERARAWNRRVRVDPATARNVLMIDPLWLVAVAVSTSASVTAAVGLPIDFAVVACQLIPLLVVAPILAITLLLLRPVLAALATTGRTSPNTETRR